MDRTEGSPGSLALVTFALSVVIGGANFIAVRFSNRELAPFWGAGLRFSLAAVLFVLIAVGLRLAWPRGRELVDTVAYGALAFAISYALMYWALVRVTAGVATVVMAVVPLVTLLLAAAQGLERLAVRGVAGAVLALLGIAWMTFGPQSTSIPLGPLVAMLVAALAIGQSIILGKRLSGNHPVMTNAVGMPSGALMLLAFSALAGERWVLPREAAARWSVLYLVTIGSVGLFVLVLLVVRRWTPSASSYMFVLFPVVTLVLGAVIADERVTVDAVIGAALVMAGVWFGALSPAARVVRTPPPEAVPPAAAEV